MKAIVISDTHGSHAGIDIPECDFLIHCGDFQRHGADLEVCAFDDWLATVPARHKLVIAGNHDRTMAKTNFKLNHAIYLQDSAVEIEGVKFYGSPWTPDFFPENWVFNQPRGYRSAQRWAQIPDDTEVLITHGPPHGIMDICRDIYDRKKVVNVGCEALKDRLHDLHELRYHLFGHIHESSGVLNTAIGFERVTFVNACSLDGHYQMFKKAYKEIEI